MGIIKIHYLNLGTLCPVGGRIFGSSEPLKCQCLLIEKEDGLILVDTGLGMMDITDPYSRLGIPFCTLIRPKLDTNETAVSTIKKLGFKKNDVKHIILTHLDIDHAGGVSDFPHAKIHLHHSELEEAENPTQYISKDRYRNFSSNCNYQTYSEFGDTWFDFKSVRPLVGLDDEIALVPLIGHSRGHSGIAIRGPLGWIFHIGDSVYGEEHLESKYFPKLGYLMLENLFQYNFKDRINNLKKLRKLKNDQDEIEIICSHDSLKR
jgi:glyoxylase-like metal-dependent hydrolase (beta-lactamase superfamily II)